MKLLVGPVCNFSAKVRLAIAEKGVVAELEEVPYSLEGGYAPKHPLVSEVNPSGTVPVLLLEDGSVYDSTIILEYLEDRFPLPALYPKPAAQRAHCRQLEAEADELLWPAVRKVKAALADGGAVNVALAERELAPFYRRLERRLTGRRYCCDEFSAADLATWVFIHAAHTLHAGPGQAFEETANWYARVAARPAFSALIVQRRAALQRLESARLSTCGAQN
jgi:glutathione S-transferase